MSLRPFTVLESRAALTPLVVDSPHSGCEYPPDFHFTCPMPFLRQTEDFAVDRLVDGAVEAGAAVLKAEFPRSYIDVNRAEDDLDPAVLARPWPAPLVPGNRTLLGLGLVRRLCKSNMPIYSVPLPIADVQRRIENYYRPYHEKLEEIMVHRMEVFGECYLINAHSMPSRSNENRTGENGKIASMPRPDFVLGDRQGTSCDPAFTRRVRDLLQEQGFSVALNDPYKGVEIVRRHGNPSMGKQALQMEINRRLYMNENMLTLHEGFPRLRRALIQFFHALTMTLMRDRTDPIAAE